jgi:ATP-dependent helicase YprA (DUF1998 family)
MLDVLFNFVLSGVKSLPLALFFLILGLLFLPNSWTLGVIRKIKPKIIEEIIKPFKIFLNTITNLYINNGFIDINKEDTTFNERTEYLLKENKKIEKNIYVIDLCKDIVSMFGFIYKDENVAYIYEEAINYLQHYSRLIEDIDQDKNFTENFTNKINQINGVVSFNDKDEKFTRAVQKRFFDEIFTYLREERNKLDVLLNNNKKELVAIIAGEVNVL